MYDYIYIYIYTHNHIDIPIYIYIYIYTHIHIHRFGRAAEDEALGGGGQRDGLRSGCAQLKSVAHLESMGSTRARARLPLGGQTSLRP